MRWALLVWAGLLAGGTAPPRYELRGRLNPGTRASVWLHGATSPFEDSTMADDAGRFRFHDLVPGAYTLGVFVPGRGEARQTVEVGPGQADGKRRVELVIDLADGRFELGESLRRGALVSARELAIPDQAWRAYEEAEKRLARRDVDGAVADFKRAVELAPRFAEAWNYLGTIAYQTRDYTQAEGCFRKALEADPKLYPPLVNLGGVLLNLSRFQEALPYNRYAALAQPNDALANSQLGMNYFYLGKVDLGQKYLTEAKRIDPAHFSHPQLLLAEIWLRRGDRTAAAGELEEFLRYHPDAPEAARVRAQVERLRSPAALQAGAAGPAAEFAASGMARSFSESPDLPDPVVRREGKLYLPGGGEVAAAVGSGRHLRALWSREGNAWKELPLAWYSEGGGRYGPSLGFGASPACLVCHAARVGEHSAAIGCATCHGTSGSGKPTNDTCLRCHVEDGGESAHGRGSGSEERFELNSAGYRLKKSRCFQSAAGKLTCTTCHPPHGFSKTTAEVRQVCRGCHPTMHNEAALECPRCHMPKRAVQDAPGVLVTDHRIQRPL